MKIIISPAKKMNFSEMKNDFNGKLMFDAKTDILIKELKSKSKNDIKKLMKLSDNLSELNYERFQNWDNAKCKKSILLFDGNVYSKIKTRDLSDDNLHFINENMMILSGLYGILKPFDTIKPYRLEMGTKLSFGNNKNLYDFWSNDITNALKNTLKPNEVLLNLASVEYFKSINTKKLDNKIIACSFKNYRNGELKNIAVYAKEARGMMINFIAKNKITNIETLKEFNYENYLFDSNLSSEEELVFTR